MVGVNGELQLSAALQPGQIGLLDGDMLWSLFIDD